VADDADGDSVTVRVYGRAAVAAPGPDFTLVGLPDTQYYTAQLNGGSNAMLKSQMQWILDNRVSRNIVHAVQLGDCTDTASDLVQWWRADTAYKAIEVPLGPAMPDGVPYGICVGNHDQSPNGAADTPGSTSNYNTYFGIARFQGRDYYGGHHADDNDNWYDLFSAGGMDFISIGLEYDTTPNAAVLNWADSILQVHADRRAIVSSHNIIGTGNPGAFATQGQAIYDALKDRPNLFLMLCGHVPGEGRRSDVFEGRTVHTLLSDFQSRTNGGSGWLRIMEFSPANGVIRVRTYSPWLNQWEADSDSSSQFTLTYDMSGAGAAFELVGTVKVAAGETATMAWPGRAGLTAYEWYATVSDGALTRTGPTWSFTTAEAVVPQVAVVAPDGGEALPIGALTNLQWTASDDVGVTSVDLELSRAGTGGPWEAVALGVANTGTYAWTVTGPATTSAWLRVTARDAAGNAASDLSDAAFTLQATAGADDAAPLAFALERMRPNPVSGPGAVEFAVPRTAPVHVGLYDVQGREVAVLADAVFEPGRHTLRWDGRGAARRLGAGLYFLRMRAPGFTAVRRVSLVH
jgi:hypothetical protein